MIKKCIVCDKEIQSQWSGEEPTRSLRSDAKYCSKRCWGIAYRTSKEGWAKSLVARCKSRAKNKNIEFDLDINFVLWLFEEQNGKCAITNLDIRFDNKFSGKIDQYRGSIDRIDSSLGYTKDNAQIVCSQVNIMKHQSSTEELLFWAKKIVEGIE